MATSQDPMSTAALDFAHQSERLSGSVYSRDDQDSRSTAAIEAKYVTPHDVVIETASHGRLPGVPLPEAYKLNQLKEELSLAKSTDGTSHPHTGRPEDQKQSNIDSSSTLRTAVPPSDTNPLFPPLPLYGPPTLLRNLQCMSFRISSCFLSLAFLGAIIIGSAVTSLPLMFRHIGLRLRFRNPDARRPFYEKETSRKKARREAERSWSDQKKRRQSQDKEPQRENELNPPSVFEPTEGGPDPLVCDVAYYARRVGLDIEEYRVQTEDGFIIMLWHIFNPKEHDPKPANERDERGPSIVPLKPTSDGSKPSSLKRSTIRYPVLLMHGLLQSSGAYCTNDDDSLAFYLAKSGYDVWLGNNRCGFNPEHTILSYADPRMWAWNIRQMGVIDLSAIVSRVLSETGFQKLGLICHSQGTTETFVALAKGQRPELGQRISVFCALAPAVYAGPLIDKAYFKFMKILSPGLFRLIFGIHAFIPFMMSMHRLLPGRLYGAMGYRVFSFLFNWTDDRWERDIRDRMFQFAPVYVSSESMRWWLGRDCFAKHKCILSTKEERKQEEYEDAEAESYGEDELDEKRGQNSWYDERAPPMALWIAGSDDLVDGRRLLRRFELGREPYVDLVHTKIIEEYEHLDVIWAMDSIEKVGQEVRSVIWSTVEANDKRLCQVPQGCEDPQARPAA